LINQHLIEAGHFNLLLTNPMPAPPGLRSHPIAKTKKTAPAMQKRSFKYF